MAYKLIFQNGYWYVRSNTGRLFGHYLDKNLAVRLLVDLEAQE
jgi:hypothetical protein